MPMKYLIANYYSSYYYCCYYARPKFRNERNLIIDSTLDISHTDQLTFIVRYINRDGVIQERFLGFLPIEEHKAKYIEMVIKELNVMSLDIKNCIGQTYDNAANMAGKYSGLQTRLRNYSPTAFVIPCANHSLKFNRKFCCRIMQ